MQLWATVARQLLGSRNLVFGTLDRPDRQTIKIWKKLDTKPNKSRLFSITSEILEPKLGHRTSAVLTLFMAHIIWITHVSFED